MKSYLTATALGCLLAASALPVFADGAKEKEAYLIHASHVLPQDDGDDFRQTLRDADDENQDIKQRVMLDHADMYDLLTAPSFDRQAFDQKAAEVRQLQDQMHRNRDDAFASAVSNLSPEERLKLANALDANPGAGKHMKHHRKTADNADDQTTAQ